MFRSELGAGNPSKEQESGPEFEGTVVRETLQQISDGKDADDPAIVIQDRNRMNPFIQHDAGNVTNLRHGCRGNNPGGHDFS